MFQSSQKKIGLDIVRGNVKTLVAGLWLIVSFLLRQSRSQLPKNPEQILTLHLKTENKSAGP